MSLRFPWARLLRRKRALTGEDLDTLREKYERSYALSRSPGWPWLVETLEAEMSLCVDKLLQPVTERERDFYASRADTLLWVIGLPKVASEGYSEALRAAADDLPTQGEGSWDPASPV